MSTPFEQPITLSPEQKISYELQAIRNIFNQIQQLCADNETAKRIFESADNWNMSLEKHLQHVQAYLEDENFEQAKKSALVSGMLPRLSAVYEALKTEAAQGRNAKVQAVKEVKEELSRFYTETVPQ